jgi:nucleoside-diphosphate-sugar epimerase
MKVAIVSGANGYLGRALTKKLLGKNIKVFALVRSDSFDLIDPNLVSIKGDLNDVESILHEIEKFSNISKSVFYHTAWRGAERLMDGDLDEQLINAVNAVNALNIAKHMKCSKFINVGSQEEKLFERHLDKLNKEGVGEDFTNLNYGTSKLAARDMCRLVAYMEKIDYIHTRLSVITDASSDRGYINSTLNKIKAGKPYDQSKNSQLYDFTDIDDITNAYVELGRNGKNKLDYYIGSGDPKPLNEYFKTFSDYINNGEIISFTGENSSNTFLEEFSNQLVLRDTGIQINNFQDNIKKYKEL